MKRFQPPVFDLSAGLLGLFLGAIFPTLANAETLVSTRTIRPQTILMPEDLRVVEGDVIGSLISLDEGVGLEARVVLYAGRPIRFEDVGPPAIIDRNQIVVLTYTVGTLLISTEARALTRGGIGDTIRVMNINSRSTLTGVVAPNGTVLVGNAAAAFN